MSFTRIKMEEEINEVESEKVIVLKPSARMGNGTLGIYMVL